MKKRFLALMMSIAMLTGCGSSGETPTAENSEASTSTATTENVAPVYAAPEMKGEISISTIEQEDVLDEAARLFMEKYPEVTVTVNSFRTIEITEMENGLTIATSGENEGESDEDYLNLLNTQLMSGNADDIILTDSLPLSKYIKMGAFEDLSGYLSQSPEISAETHNMDVFELLKEDSGELYEIPMSWGVGSILVFDQALVDASGIYLDDSITSMNYADALEYGKQLVDGSDLPNTYLELNPNAINTATKLLNSRLDEFVDFDNQTVDINNQEFIDIISYAKNLQDEGYYDTDGTTDYNMEYHLGLKVGYGVSTAYNALLPETEYYRALPMSNSDGSISGKALYRLGITSGSANKELAWEFIKFLLSDEVQTLRSFYFMGVNKNGRDAYIKTYYDAVGGSETDVTLEDVTALIDNWIGEINHYTRQDSSIKNLFIYPEVEKFLNGKQTAEETAAVLQTKIDKYLNE